MDRSTLFRVVLPVLAVLTTGCITLATNPLDVPFHPQSSPNRCGVNCLAMAFDYFRIPYDFAELDAQSFVPALNGSPPELLADVAETYGLRAEIENLDAAGIKSSLESGALPIVFIPPAQGTFIGHFILVTRAGQNPQQIRAHDGKRRNRRLRLRDNTYVTLLLAPPRKGSG